MEKLQSLNTHYSTQIFVCACIKRGQFFQLHHVTRNWKRFNIQATFRKEYILKNQSGWSCLKNIFRGENKETLTKHGKTGQILRSQESQGSNKRGRGEVVSPLFLKFCLCM